MRGQNNITLNQWSRHSFHNVATEISTKIYLEHVVVGFLHIKAALRSTTLVLYDLIQDKPPQYGPMLVVCGGSYNCMLYGLQVGIIDQSLASVAGDDCLLGTVYCCCGLWWMNHEPSWCSFFDCPPRVEGVIDWVEVRVSCNWRRPDKGKHPSIRIYWNIKYIVFIEDINAISHRDYRLQTNFRNRTIKQRNEGKNAT